MRYKLTSHLGYTVSPELLLWIEIKNAFWESQWNCNSAVNYVLRCTAKCVAVLCALFCLFCTGSFSFVEIMKAPRAHRKVGLFTFSKAIKIYFDVHTHTHTWERERDKRERYAHTHAHASKGLFCWVCIISQEHRFQTPHENAQCLSWGRLLRRWGASQSNAVDFLAAVAFSVAQPPLQGTFLAGRGWSYELQCIMQTVFLKRIYQWLDLWLDPFFRVTFEFKTQANISAQAQVLRENSLHNFPTDEVKIMSLSISQTSKKKEFN